jgi:UDP-N-acetylglucosamine acyltransferase
LAAVHQNVRIGRLVMIGGGAMCTQDVPPFTLAQGDRARLYGLNVVGLRRALFDPAVRRALQTAWRILFVSGLPRRAAEAKVGNQLGNVAEVRELLDFLKSSRRGVCRAPASVSG